MHSVPRPPAIREASPTEANELVAAGALLIDIREQAEWDQARIPDAELRPMSQINDWWRELPSEREVVVYCKTGVRSANVVHALTDQAGLDNVINLGGGIVAWYEADLPVDFAADV